jgi:O-antigen/teichoic acid export membrane protein
VQSKSSLYTTSSSWLARIVSIGTNLLITRLIVQSYGEGVFSGWVIVFNICGWFGLVDFGVSAALQYYTAKDRTDLNYIRRIACLIGIAFTAIGFFTIAIIYVFSSDIANYTLQSIHNLDPTYKNLSIILCCSSAVVWSLSGAFQKLLYGIGEGIRANVFLALGQICSLLSVYWVCGHIESNQLSWIGLAHFAPASIIWLILWISFLKDCKIPAYKVAIFDFSKIIKKSLEFGAFAILSALVLRIDYLVLSEFSDSRGIFEYSMIARFLGLPLFAYTAYLAALQSEFTAHRAEVSKRYRSVPKTIAMGFLAIIIGTIGLIGFSGKLVPVLAPGVDPNLDVKLILLSGVYHCLRVWTDTYSMIILAMGRPDFFLKIVPLQAVVSIVAQIGLGAAFGTIGVLLGLCISYLLTVAIILPRISTKLVHEETIP